MRHLIPLLFPPCRQTMGPCSSSSARRARRLQNCPGGLSDMCAYLYCCTASACKADGVEFVHVYEEYREQRDADRKDCKERARLIAEILIQLQLRKRVTPRQLLRLPWDYEPQERKATRRSPRPPRARKSLGMC